MKKRLLIFYFVLLSCWCRLSAQVYTVSACTPTYYAPAGTFLTLGDDVVTGAITLPFTFTFFGTPYTQLIISSNGFVSFDLAAPSGCCSGQVLPNTTTPNNLIAATWEDIYPPGGGTVSYQTIGTAPNRIFVVAWDNVPHYISGNPVSIQLQLYETSNDIRCVLQSMPTDGGMHTCGIENAAGTVAYFPAGHNGTSWSATNECWLFSPCPQPPAPTASGTSTCNGQTATLTATGVVGATFEWYDAAVGGTLLGSGASFTTPVLSVNTTYYVQQTLANCPSVRTAVTVTVNLNTTGTISPNPITLNACSASPVTGTVTISNTGSCPLSWSTNSCDPPLATVLSNLNTNAASIISQIPTPFTLQAICNACAGGLPDGACGNNICDGGGDMYDGGNELTTNLLGVGNALNYSDNAIIANAAALGTGGQYFTRLVSTYNLWVFAADVNGLTSFSIWGNNGADGTGNVDGTVLTGTACGNTYKGFVKRVYNASDPSINHLVIIKDNGTLSHTFAASTDDDGHTVSGLTGVTRIYHVLFGSNAGAYVSNAQMQNIMNTFITNVSSLGGVAPLPSWASISPTSGIAPVGGTSTTTITFDPTSLAAGAYNSTLNLTYNGGTFAVPLVFNVGTVLAAPTASGTSICSGLTATLSATGSTGATFQWYDAPTGGTLLSSGASYTTPTLTTTTTYYVQQTLGLCVSSRTPVTVTVTSLLAPTASGTTVCFNTGTTLTATGNVGATFQWYDALTGGTLLGSNASYATPLITSTTTYYVQQTLSGCVSTRTAVTVVVNAPAPPTVAGTTICYNTSATLSVSGSVGATFQWYDNLIGGTLLGTGATFTTPNLVVNTTYYVQQTVAGCVSGRTAVTVAINSLAPPTASGVTICPNSTATLTVTGVAGATFQWYDALTGGTLLGSGTSFTTPTLAANTSYYVQQTSAGCSSTRTTVLVTVGDIIPPTITCPGTQFLVLLAGCSNTLPNYTNLGTKNDNCTPVASLVTTQSPAAGTLLTGVGTTSVTLTVTDAAGNQASCTFNVNKVDVNLPNIACPATQTLILDASCSASLPNYTSMATASDNCGIASVSQSPLAGTIVTGIGTMVITLTATDVNGNTKTCTFNVNKVDNTPPSLTCPGAQTLNVGVGCSVTLLDYTSMVTATDNCASSLTVTQSPVAGTVITGAGVTLVTISATDGNGNTATCTITVNRVDTGLPAITCPSNQSLPLDTNCSAVLPDYTLLATASDGCLGTVTITQSPAIGTVVNGVGAISVTLTATDASNNTATCTFTVNKVDTTPPTVICPLVSPTLSVNAACSVILPNYASVATATDNCSNGVIVTQSPAPNTVLTGLAPTIVTLTATDIYGNIGTCTFNVLKLDVTPPTITCPAPVTAQVDSGNCSATNVVLGNPTTNDNCTVASVSNDAPLIFPLGTTIVTWTVTDGGGNTATCFQTVTVQDNISPVITCPANMNITVTSAAVCGAIANFPLNATDNCSLASLTASPASGTVFPLGTTPVTLTATDVAGNSATCTFTVTVTMGTFNVLNNPNLNYTADAECTDLSGWTHYFHTPSNSIILSIQKNGNNIGNIAGGVQVTTATNGNFGSNTAQHIAFPTALYPQNPLWYVVNRYWHVTPVTQPSSPVKVRFYFTGQDTADLNGSLNPNTTITTMKMYKINGAYNPNPDPDNNPATYDGHSGVPLAPSRNGDGYVEYSNGASATGQTWVLGNYSSDYYAEYEIDMFSGGGGGSGSASMGALPVELLSFTGEHQQPYNHLHWTTASEANSSYFEVQKWNYANADYDVLGIVGAKGNSQSLESYHFRDDNPEIGKNMYRLKIVDINGEYGYSNLVNIWVTNDDFFALYPNPAKDEVFIKVFEDLTDNMSLTLYDATGKQVARNVWTLSENHHIYTLAIGQLPQGVYMYKVVYGNKRHTGKLMIVK